MLADGTPYARVYVPEPLRTRFTAGTKVAAPSMANARHFQGTVRYVSAEASFTPYYALTQKDRSRLSYLAEVTLDDPTRRCQPAGAVAAESQSAHVPRPAIDARRSSCPASRSVARVPSRHRARDDDAHAGDRGAWPDPAFRQR